MVTTIGQKYNATPAQVLLQWALRQGVGVIPGATSVQHIVENLQVPDFPMTDEEAAAIENAHAPRSWFDSNRGPFKLDGKAAETAWLEAQKKKGH
jgi:diketogulonate reductase-like aldo/keto reductase